MKILLLSDAHGNVEAIGQMKKAAENADIVLYAGDFADQANPQGGTIVLESLLKLHDTVFAVTGNCDDPSFKEVLEEKDISIEGSLSNFSGLLFAGSGGGTIFTQTSPNERTEDDIVADFAVLQHGNTASGDETLAEDSNSIVIDSSATGLWDNLVLVMHNPPADTACDMIAGGIHVGSQKLRSVIELYRPLLVVCGHIHESAAIDHCGGTTVINPGALLDGHYAVVEILGGSSCPFRIEKAELF